jgi:hypothetical protein
MNTSKEVSIKTKRKEKENLPHLKEIRKRGKMNKE